MKALRDYIRKITTICEKVICFSLVLVITPCYYIFEMTVVRPVIVETYNMGTIKHIFHVILSSFCFINVVGNMALSISTDTKVRDVYKYSNDHCEECKAQRPAKAWHCKTCNACILKRDHHCFFLSRCIGLRNQRYFVLFLGYTFVSMIYSLYYNYYYVVAKFEDQSVILSVFRVINPFLRYLIPEPMGVRDLYVLFLFLNTGLAIWCGGLLYFHTMNVLRGLTAHEYRKEFDVSWPMMKRNFVSVFGVKWHWAIVSPFVESPLPEDIGTKYQ